MRDCSFNGLRKRRNQQICLLNRHTRFLGFECNGDFATATATCNNSAIVKIAYRVSEKDYVDAHDLLAASGPGRYSRRSLPWFGACVLGAEAYYLIVQPRRDIVLIVIGLAVGLSLLCYGFAHRQWFRRDYRKDHRFKHEF